MVALEWVERSETHHLRGVAMGFAIALPILHITHLTSYCQAPLGVTASKTSLFLRLYAPNAMQHCRSE